jgi:replicative DNA helicase
MATHCPLESLETLVEYVNDAARKDDLVVALSETLTDSRRPGSTISLLDGLDRRLAGLRTDSVKAELISIGDAIMAAMTQTNSGLPSGFSHFDRQTGGLHPGNLVVIGARPGVGKTALGVAIADRVARSGKWVGIFSLEMTASEICHRLMALHGVTMQEAKDLRGAAREAGDSVGRLPLKITDHRSTGVVNIRASARKSKIDLVIVDYLQLVKPERIYKNRSEAIDEVCVGLKHTARELGIPIIALAQMNRSVEDRSSAKTMARPRLSDLRESGGIENNADVVALLHREKYYDPTDNSAELLIAKNRQGPRFRTQLTFSKDHATFTETFEREHYTSDTDF